jgi:hypothetical protein
VGVRPFNLGSAANANSPRAALSAFALADNDDGEKLELWTVPSPDGSDGQTQIGGPSVVQAAINGDTSSANSSRCSPPAGPPFASAP